MNFEKKPIIIAGPCSVESYQQIMTIAQKIKSLGIEYLRAGAFKPRTRKNSFSGLGEEGLKYLLEVKEKFGLKIVSEIMSEEDLELFQKYKVDVLQIGARNMQNFRLLERIGKTNIPVLLKRGPSADFDEIVGAIERLENNKVIFCLRGLKIMQTENLIIDKKIQQILVDNNPWQHGEHRNYIDIEDINKVKNLDIIKKRNIPVIYDPSHSCGIASDVPKISLEALRNGADGIIIEVHHNPSEALSDSKQQIDLDEFENLLNQIEK